MGWDAIRRAKRAVRTALISLGASFGGQSVVSRAGEAYSAQGMGPNRKFRST
jgi:hypothetical protein